MKSYNTIFIFAYYSFKDPVFQSAVLPYFSGLHKIEPKLRFVLLTFEQEKYSLENSEVSSIKNELANQNIFWHRTNWHSGFLKGIKKLFDFVCGTLISIWLIKKYRAKLVYSEGMPGAIIGHYLSKINNLPHIIHTFEPHAEYMQEANVWKDSDWEYIFLKKLERKVAISAKVIMTATTEYGEILKSWGTKALILRVPSCVDLEVFNYSQEKRDEIRKRLNIKESEVVITHLGKFGGMYMDHEIFDFFKVCEDYKELNFKYFIFSNEKESKILKKIVTNNLPKDKFLVKYIERDGVSSYLSASDFGLVAVRQHPGKRFCSPIKDGEYWACGLPIIIPRGVSDDYLLAKQEQIGIEMLDFTGNSFIKVCDELKEWSRLGKIDITERCRNFVIKDRNVRDFNKLYIQLFMN